MSASTERKNRQTARSAGTDKKSVAFREAEKKKKKEKIKWTVVSICVVLFFVLVIYMNTGAFYRGLTAFEVNNPAVEANGIEAGSTSFSVAEVNYVYNMQFMNMYSQYGQYASMLGLDFQQPLDQQECAMGAPAEEGEEGAEAEMYTWDDYFMDAAKHELTEYAAYAAYAKAQGITLDDEAYAQIDETIATIGTTAKENDYGSANKFLATNYGNGVNTNVVRNVMEMELLAAKVQETVANAKEYSAEELADYYDTVKDDYDKFSYSFYLVEAESTTDEEGNTEISDEALAAAKAKADDILAKLEEGGEFDAVVAEVIGQVEQSSTDENGIETVEMVDAAPSVKSDISGSAIETAIQSWMVKADRAKGDKTVIEDKDAGAYVVVFTSRDNMKHTTSESGDQNYCDFVAENLLKNDAVSAWQSDVFEGIEAVFELSTKGACRYVGR